MVAIVARLVWGEGKGERKFAMEIEKQTNLTLHLYHKQVALVVANEIEKEWEKLSSNPPYTQSIGAI